MGESAQLGLGIGVFRVELSCDRVHGYGVLDPPLNPVDIAQYHVSLDVPAVERLGLPACPDC